jgi:thiosulfate dehydrogenase (quinone) large subunit
MQRLTLVRLALGVLFLWSGVAKALGGFTAASYLTTATGPVASVFQTLAGNPVVDFLVVFGEIGIGLALLSGLFLTFACYSGMLMMALFYFSKFPPAHGLVNDQVIYFLLFWLFAEKDTKNPLSFKFKR